MNLAPIDQIWLLICSALVLLMQAGFLCLETGLTRSKNSVNVAFKNLADLAFAPLMFWLVGAWIMFGVSHASWNANSGSGLLIPLLFQSLFCATAATIVSGAVAERMRLNAYAVVAMVICLAVYPTIGSWAWGGAYGGSPGWLERLGFQDFAGSAVVHMTGGFASLAAVLVVGPRTGRFAPGRRKAGFPKSNLPLALLGAMLLFVGWVGFNGGSTGAFNDSVSVAVLNTVLAGVAGCTTTFVLAAAHAARSRNNALSCEGVINGLIGALVASCAAADIMRPEEAAIVGSIAAIVVWFGERLLLRWKIDDVIGAFPAHGIGGIVGVLAVAFVANSESSIGVQALGALTIGSAAFLSVYVPLRLFAPLSWLRVSKEEEQRGMNEVEHGVKSEFQVLSQGLSTALSEASSKSQASNVKEVADDDAEVLVKTYGALIDETSEKAAQRAREEEHSRTAKDLENYDVYLNAVLDSLDAHVAIVDSQGLVIDSNSHWQDFVRQIGVIGNDGIQHIHSILDQGSDESSLGVKQAIDAITAGATVSVDAERQVTINGGRHYLHLRVKALPAGGRGCAIVVQRDLTQIRASQKDLVDAKNHAETLADALETSNKAIDLAIKGGNLSLWHWDAVTGYFEISADWLSSLGYENLNLGSDINGFRGLLHPDDQVLWSVEDAASLAMDEPYDRQFRLRKADGTFMWAQALGRANSQQPGRPPESLSGILLDIDGRKNAELRDLGMAKIIEQSFNEVYLADASTLNFVQMNRGARENLGLSNAELVNLTPADIAPEFDMDKLRSLVEPLDSGEKDRIEFETVHRRSDGSSYPVMISLQRSDLVGRDVYVGVGVDLTQRRRLEAQLANAQKLESIGQLAAGVAHEMNTPLQYVGNNITYLSDCSERLFEVIDHYQALVSGETPPTPWNERIEEANKLRQERGFDRLRNEIPRALSESIEGVQRVLEIVRAMKEFSHPGDRRLHATDLNQLITSMTTVTRNRWKNVADLDLQLDPSLPPVNCDAGSINQVIVNLIVNAADAIADIQEPEASLGKITLRTRAEEDHAIIEANDTGCGMPPEVVEKIFDPFFTTKEVGKGTGQGLSLSHTIITQHHGGSISVESEPGVGTTFRVRLPFNPAEAQSEAYPSASHAVEA